MVMTLRRFRAGYRVLGGQHALHHGDLPLSATDQRAVEIERDAARHGSPHDELGVLTNH